MSYLRFEKAVMTNLQESLRRELLRTNRSGAYSSSTLVDCNTRKYHGLLVVPVPELDWDFTSIKATISVLTDTSTSESLMPVSCQRQRIAWVVSC